MSSGRTSTRLAALTEREREVLALMAQGLSDREIAQRLSVSLPTVSTHGQSLYRKLALAGTTENRRVSAVLAYLREQKTRPGRPS